MTSSTSSKPCLYEPTVFSVVEPAVYTRREKMIGLFRQKELRYPMKLMGYVVTTAFSFSHFGNLSQKGLQKWGANSSAISPDTET